MLGVSLRGGPPASVGDTLDWEAPPSCPTVEGVRRRLAALVPGDRRAAGARVAATVRVEHGSEGWSASLTVRSSTGVSQHVLHGPDCDTLADAVALIVAVHLDPVSQIESASSHSDIGPKSGDAEEDVLRRAGDGALQPGAGPKVRKHGQASPSRVRRTPEERRRDRRLQRARRRGERGPAALGARLFTAVGYGVLPKVDIGAGLGLAWIGGGYRLEAVGARWFPQSAYVSGAGSAGAEVGLWSGDLRACPVIGPSDGIARWEVPICVFFEGGAMVARPFKLDDSRVGVGAWLAGGIAPSVHWRPRGWLSLWLELSGHAVLRAPGVRADGPADATGVFHHARPLGVRASAGVEFRLRPQRPS